METRPDWAQVATDCGRAALDSIGALHGNTGEIGDDEIEPTAPCALAGVAIRVCLLLAGTWKAVGEEARKENWLRAASSLHTVTFGGGQPMLARIFEHHLRTAGLNAGQSSATASLLPSDRRAHTDAADFPAAETDELF
jgi:hypothetical protein